MGKGVFFFFFASIGYDLSVHGPDCHNTDVLFSFGLYAIGGKNYTVFSFLRKIILYSCYE